jgi:hypothetical protein
MPQVGKGNSVTKVVFDPSLGRHGGTRYRGAGGRFTPNLNKGKPWYCQKSPTGSHHWFITARQGRCKYCQAVQDLQTSAPGAPPKRGRGA